ncbi:lytic transglycosylase domain-containing protein [Ancylobacter sp. Lp-2]|uniref:lytic transglycosylase domain-containing protein n=1 Tax=Ancylobacter sp. Lp-2 TaxID=2881339 RepID=UPI001E5A972A|nr:lytic transglycosylase domain-containing protein [Ancylobacter sp. Lp-2]MCB4770419.1 lytic transglycosylase domain-containing protein [Ancylobacter sp. Lp-2]
MPVVLLTPVARNSAGLVAPSYAVWLTDPPHGAPLGGRFVARGQAIVEVAVFQREIPAPPPAPPAGASTASAAISSALSAPASVASAVPLPPKLLAEMPRIVMASLVPLPPKRLSAPMSYAPQTGAAPEETAPAETTSLRDDAASEDPNAPTEDAARPIDDAPEPVTGRATSDRAPPRIEALIVRYAERFDVPARLVRRVAWRESNFDQSKRHGPYWGLMQIRVDTARALGFRGAPRDLLDADVNMAYAVAYLANAYRVAGRDEKRAVVLYASGYYYEAKRKGMLNSLIRTASAEQ